MSQSAYDDRRMIAYPMAVRMIDFGRVRSIPDEGDRGRAEVWVQDLHEVRNGVRNVEEGFLALWGLATTFLLVLCHMFGLLQDEMFIRLLEPFGADKGNFLAYTWPFMGLYFLVTHFLPVRALKRKAQWRVDMLHETLKRKAREREEGYQLVKRYCPDLVLEVLGEGI